MNVGTVLVGEASGIQNIRLGCLALGMSKAEVEDRLGELVEFTELGDAIFRPLKTYSSGMRARVQFVVATAQTPRILLIDEALGVGDKVFRRKSRSRVEEIIDAAGTLFMVNHSLDELANFCSRGIWLHEGRLIKDGPIDEVIEAYNRMYVTGEAAVESLGGSVTSGRSHCTPANRSYTARLWRLGQ